MENVSNVHVTIKPLLSEDAVISMETTVSIEYAAYKKGDIFDVHPTNYVGCTMAGYTNEDFKMSDDNGSFGFVCEERSGDFGPERAYLFDRDVSGRIEMSYCAKVLEKDWKRRGPEFSLHRTYSGCTASGLAFLILPKDGVFNYSISYDLSSFRGTAAAACGFGEGDFSKICNGMELKETYYVIGDLKRFHKEGSKLHIVWLADEIRLVDSFCETMAQIFDRAEKMFHDDDLPYYIFLYPTPQTDATGIALNRCCFFGFGDQLVESVEKIEGTIAHELVHNWLVIKGAPVLESLFAEGAAEFYSCYILFLLGKDDADGYVERINTKLRKYYANPYSKGRLVDAFEKSWTHSYAQIVPYGRGILLLMHLDALLNRCTKGKVRLYNLMTELLDGAKEGVTMTWDRFVSLADGYTEGAASDFIKEIMEEGIIAPPKDFFGEGYTVIEDTVAEIDSGFDDTVRFSPDKVVKGVRPGSNAEAAGLRNGDVLLFASSDWTVTDSENEPLVCDIRRGNDELSISYLPRGKKVPCWKYIKS